eukprot:60979-Rhodomonas_salina.1
MSGPERLHRCQAVWRGHTGRKAYQHLLDTVSGVLDRECREKASVCMWSAGQESECAGRVQSKSQSVQARAVRERAEDPFVVASHAPGC